MDVRKLNRKIMVHEDFITAALNNNIPVAGSSSWRAACPWCGRRRAPASRSSAPGTGRTPASRRASARTTTTTSSPGRNSLHHFRGELCHNNLLFLLTAFSRSGPHLYFEAVGTALVFSFMGLVAFPCLAFPVLANWQEQQQQQWYDDTTICVPILKANMPKLMSVSFYICWAKYMLNYIFENNEKI